MNDTATKPSNLFAKAKTAEKPAAKQDKTIFLVSDYPELPALLRDLYSARVDKQNAEAKEAMAAGQIKPYASNKFLEAYAEQKRRPESFVLKTSTGEAIMVLPTDRYRTLDEPAYEELKGKYGQDAVEMKNEYIFDSDILGKNMDAVSAAIMGSPDISDADKADLVKVKTTYGVRKGVIDRLSQYGDKMFDLYSDIAPVMQLKNCK